MAGASRVYSGDIRSTMRKKNLTLLRHRSWDKRRHLELTNIYIQQSHEN